jgi:hypothetical protein
MATWTTAVLAGGADAGWGRGAAGGGAPRRRGRGTASDDDSDDAASEHGPAAAAASTSTGPRRALHKRARPATRPPSPPAADAGPLALIAETKMLVVQATQRVRTRAHSHVSHCRCSCLWTCGCGGAGASSFVRQRRGTGCARASWRKRHATWPPCAQSWRAWPHALI